MSKLVDELKKEHIIIVETLNKVKSLSIASEKGRNTILAAKSGLLAHLKKEDEKLYPLLNKAAENDPSLRKNLDMFAKDMDEISKAALAFFDKYTTGESSLDFVKDFGRLFATLSIRIKKEESIIYSKFNELEK